jgi:hypothetical protein
MYQNNQQNAFQNQLGSSNASSQSRGMETRYQPIGNVQSQYSQSDISSSGQNGFQNAIQNSGFQNQSPQSYQTASYRGNQQGHDAYLRADSTQPSQSQFGSSFGNQGTSSFNNMGTSLGSQQQFGSQQQYGQQQTPESFHTASYRGNQQGHDANLRADSTQPSQSQYGTGATSGFSSFNMGMNSNPFGSNQQQNQLNQQYQQNQQNQQQYTQFQNPQSFHTANYRGNQQGHDANLRADSTQPSQSQFGGANNNFNRYQF